MDKQTLADKMAEEIADSILSGALEPGTRLDENSLATRYGVSRTPVREALRQLAASGLIEVKPHRGATVTPLTQERLEDLFIAMGELEATCARLSALGMTPLERRRLQALHERMAEYAAAGDTEAYTEANQVFHSTIYGGAHNEALGEMTTALRRRLAPFRRAQFRKSGRLLQSHAEHDAVVKAILAGNAAGAHAAMLYHVSLVEEAFEQLASPA